MASCLSVPRNDGLQPSILDVTAGKSSLLEGDQRNATVIANEQQHIRRRDRRRRTGRQHSRGAARTRQTSRHSFRARKVSAFSYRRVGVAIQHEGIYPARVKRQIFERWLLKKIWRRDHGRVLRHWTKFYFKDGYRSQTDHAYQVTRSDFDKVLLDHAAESGAEVHEQTVVSNVMFRADEVLLSYKSVSCNEVGSVRCADRTSQRDVPTTEGEVRARYLVDASGRTSVLGIQFKIKKTYDHLQKLSIFAHYDGAWRPEGIDGVEGDRPYPIFFVAIVCFCLTNCASVTPHQFSEPAAGWQTKNGQVMYRTAKATLIGEAIVRLSKTGDFDLTVSKGPGITLLSLRQDAEFAEFNASITGQHWSGSTASAPPRLRGWLGLRDQFLRAPNQKTLRYVSGSETFLFRF
jgi:hypothetical protein